MPESQHRRPVLASQPEHRPSVPIPADADQSQDDRATENLTRARAVLDIEIRGLRALSDSLDGCFSAAVERLLALRGKVIVTGMGKSGHVAHKIAATLASTGTPSFFVHPGEASHGDLGMIGPEDAVIALSNSGETPELNDLTAYTRRFNILLISITGRADSMLSDAADVALVLPDLTEACPHGLAPTTSTIMMMALGDALAVALLQRRGFSAMDFRQFHPGGKLGQQLLRCADLMHGGEALPLVSPGTPMGDVVIEISAKSLGCAGVIDNTGCLVGIVTDGDLRRHMGHSFLSLTASDVMTPAPTAVPASMMALEALGLMNRRSISGLFIIDDANRPLGFLHLHDCLRAGLA